MGNQDHRSEIPTYKVAKERGLVYQEYRHRRYRRTAMFVFVVDKGHREVF